MTDQKYFGNAHMTDRTMDLYIIFYEKPLRFDKKTQYFQVVMKFSCLLLQIIPKFL